MKLMSIWEELKSRKDMPQIDKSDIKDAVSILRDNGIEVQSDNILPGDLKHSQKEVIKSKVQNIINDMKGGKKMPPIIISKDDHIVDGHHRNEAYKVHKPKEKISVVRINLSKEDLL